MTDLPTSRRLWRTLEPYHGMIYFTPRAVDAYAALGITGRAGYFSSRAAAMGAVSAEMVIATFYNFHPALVRSAIPAAWDRAAPEVILTARLDAADRALRELIGDDAVSSPEMVEAATLARRAADVAAAAPAGRPLFAAHAALDWPEEPHLALWHAITLLREFRGDGHIAALLVNGLDPAEALVTHEAAGDGLLPAGILQRSRAWPDDEWAAAGGRLRDRGLLDADGLTADGRVLRQQIEDQTDVAAAAPWSALGDDACRHLGDLVRPWSRAIADSGVFLSGAGLT